MLANLLSRNVHRLGKSSKLSYRCQSNERKLFPNDHDSIYMLSECPGPKSNILLEEITKLQNPGAVNFFVDYEMSHGNFIVDADGNRLLDMFMQISSVALGYNHPAIIEAITDPKNASFFVNRPDLSTFPPSNFQNRLVNTLMSVAPCGLNEVSQTECGAGANESAVKQIFMRGVAGNENSEPDRNKPDHQGSILSFANAFHGRLFTVLSTTHTSPIHKLDLPAFDWPIADFPQLQYPLDEHVVENKKEEERCLAMVEDLIERWSHHCPVAGVIIEPIQSEGGDNHASGNFFRSIQRICKSNNVALIIDEVQTGGGATGAMWMHELFDLPESPDMVTFSKKMMTGGFYSKRNSALDNRFKSHKPWVGDPSKVILLEAFLKEMKSKDLLNNVRKVGEILQKGLFELSVTYPNFLSNVRGAGTLCAVDIATPALRTIITTQLRGKGIYVGISGPRAIRTRPSLTFQEYHVEIFLEKFSSVLEELKQNY